MMLTILHSFVNIFAGGRSDIKTFLFFLYLVLLSVIFILFKKYSFKSFRWIWFGITLLSMYIYGLVLHIFYIFSNNLKLSDFILTGNNGEISSSVFYHTHIAKGVIGQIFSLFGKNQFPTTDAGNAYVGIFPSWILLIGSTLFIFILFQAVYYFISSFKKIILNVNNRQKVFLILGYALITFSLIKTSIDGGIFNSGFIISTIFIILFILRKNGKFLMKHYYFLTSIGFILLFIGLYIDSSSYYYYFLPLLSFASLFLLYTLVFYLTEHKINSQFLFILIILFLSGWWMTSVRDRSFYDYSQTLLAKDGSVYIYNSDKKEVETLKVAQNQSILQLSKTLDKNITYIPVVVPGVLCMEKAVDKEIYFNLITSFPINKDKFTPSLFIKIKNKESIFNGKNWETKLEVTLNPCTPESLSVIDGELQKNGINSYLMINPILNDSTDF